MVDTKAEEDDDEGFGDFTFAPFPNHAVHSDQINGRKSTAADDDEWGNFVESPLRSELSQTSKPSKSFDPLRYFSDRSISPSQSVATPTESAVPSRAESEKIQWVKPKGPIPLSIFGDEEQEAEQSGAVDTPGVDVKGSAAGDKHASNVGSGSNMLVGLSANGIIADLYSQSQQQMKADNGVNSNSNGSDSSLIGTNLSLNGVHSRTNGLTNLNLSGLNWNSDLFAVNDNNQRSQIKMGNGFSSNSHLVAGNNDFWTMQNKMGNGFSSNSRLVAGNNDSLGLQNQMESWLSSNSDFFAGNQQSGLNSNADLVSGNKDSQRQQIKAVSGLNSYSNGLNLNTELFSWNIVLDALTNHYAQSPQDKSGVSHSLNSNLNTATSNLSGLGSKYDDKAISNLNPPGGNEEFYSDDDGWEFKDAYSELEVGDGNEEVAGKELGNYEVSGFGNGSHGSIDLFSASNGFSHKPREVDIGLGFKPVTVAQNGFSSELSECEQNFTDNGRNSDPVIGSVHSDESFGEFEGAFAESGLKQGVTEKTTENHKALPLSIFGDEELETSNSLDVQDAFTYTPSLHPRNGTNSLGSNNSIRDLISNLYSQAEQIPSVDNAKELTGNGLDSFDKVLDPGPSESDDEFDDASWEFKDAPPQTTAADLTSLHNPGEANRVFPTKLNLINYVDFYSKLKDELSFVCRCHIASLKNTAALSGEDAKVVAIEEEIQEAYKELHRENINSNDFARDQPPRDICLNEFLGVLQEPKFQLLESEYNLAKSLRSAERDLRSAIELLKHSQSMLNFLTLGSSENQCNYVSTWSNMISVCAQELKHGSCIWKQLVEKNLQSSVLSEPRGKRFILALGEIYRVVVILGASTKLFKPWVLSSSADCASTCALLKECYALWSSSGIEVALQGILDPIDFKYHSTVKGLRESIKSICNLEVSALGNHIFNQQGSVCRLSLLTSEAVPEMKMVSWSEEYYFLPLANLWANLISCDPPELPRLHVGS